MNNPNELESLRQISVIKYNETFFGHKNDVVSVEEPLEIRLIYGTIDKRVTRKVAITMRTPGSDELLALGFLYNEGIIEKHSDVMKVIKNTYHKGVLNSNVITVALLPTVSFDELILNRNFYTTSSCGVCGKSSIEAIQQICNHKVKSDAVIDPRELLGLSAKLRERQVLFDVTGGIHAVALFINQEIVAFAEDVGRHNAMDKLTGQLLERTLTHLDSSTLLLSGRASFELLQKAAVNGIPIVCAVGAPSSLAVDMAIDFNITLVGFLRDHSFNVYSHNHRIKTKLEI